jgi:hypothetical protein
LHVAEGRKLQADVEVGVTAIITALDSSWPSDPANARLRKPKPNGLPETYEVFRYAPGDGEAQPSGGGGAPRLVEAVDDSESQASEALNPVTCLADTWLSESLQASDAGDEDTAQSCGVAPSAIASDGSRPNPTSRIRAVHDPFGVFSSERVLALAQATAPRDGEAKPSSGPDDSADEMLPKRMQCLRTADSAAEKQARAVSLEKLAVAQAAAAADSRRRFFLGDGSDDGSDSDGDDEVAGYTMGGGAAGISGAGGAGDSAAAADAVLPVPVLLTSAAATLPAPAVQAQPTALVETAAQPTLAAVDLRSTDGAQETHQQPPGATGDTPSEIEV